MDNAPSPIRNRAAHKAANREWYLKNREARLAYQREYRLNNKDSIATYLLNTEDHRLACQREWNKANPESAREWRMANNESGLEYNHRQRARVAGGGGLIAPAAMVEHRAEYGQACANPNCGITVGAYGRPMTIDHIMPIAKGGQHVISNIQFLCQPCNSAKGDSTAVHVELRRAA